MVAPAIAFQPTHRGSWRSTSDVRFGLLERRLNVGPARTDHCLRKSFSLLWGRPKEKNRFVEKKKKPRLSRAIERFGLALQGRRRAYPSARNCPMSAPAVRLVCDGGPPSRHQKAAQAGPSNRVCVLPGGSSANATRWPPGRRFSSKPSESCQPPWCWLQERRSPRIPACPSPAGRVTPIGLQAPKILGTPLPVCRVMVPFLLMRAWLPRTVFFFESVTFATPIRFIAPRPLLHLGYHFIPVLLVSSPPEQVVPFIFRTLCTVRMVLAASRFPLFFLVNNVAACLPPNHPPVFFNCVSVQHCVHVDPVACSRPFARLGHFLHIWYVDKRPFNPEDVPPTLCVVSHLGPGFQLSVLGPSASQSRRLKGYPITMTLPADWYRQVRRIQVLCTSATIHNHAPIYHQRCTIEDHVQR